MGSILAKLIRSGIPKHIAKLIDEDSGPSSMQWDSTGTAPVDPLGSSPNALASVNSLAFQTALNASGLIAVRIPGRYQTNRPLLVGSNTTLRLSPGVKIEPGGTHQGVLIRTGNAEFCHQEVDAGLTILCADTQTGGTGQLKFQTTPARLSWQAPGDVAFGATVDISGGNGKYRIPSATAGMALYVTVSAQPTNSRTYSVAVAPHKGATAVTLSCTSNVVTVPEVAHGRKSGDLIQVYGEAGWNGSFEIEVVDENSYTYSHTRANGTSSTAVVFGMNNIEFDLGGTTIDGKNGTLTSPNAGVLKNTIVIRNVNGGHIRGAHIKNAMKYGVLLSACTGFDSLDITADTSSDTIHLLSPLRDVLVQKTRSKGGDNVIGFGNSDYAGQVYDLPGEAGYFDAKNVKVRNTRGVNTNQDIIRMYGSDTTGAFRDIEIDGVHGTFTTNADAAVAVYTDTALTLVSAGNQRNNIYGLKIKNVTAKCKDSTVEKRQVYFAAASGETGNKYGVEIDGVEMTFNGAVGGNKGSIYINCAMHAPVIRGLRPAVTPFAGHGVYLGAAAAITGQLEVSDVRGIWNNTAYAVSGSSAVILADQGATTAEEIEFHNFSLTDTSPSGQALNGIFVTSNGVGSAVAREGYIAGIKNLVEFYLNTNAPKFRISGITGAISGGRNPLPLKASCLGFSAVISDMVGNFANLAESGSASGTCKLRTHNTDGAVLSNGYGYNVTGGAATHDVSGDVRAILSQISRTAGNMVRAHTALGTIPAGARVVCDDSGAANSWKAVHNTALVY